MDANGAFLSFCLLIFDRFLQLTSNMRRSIDSNAEFDLLCIVICQVILLNTGSRCVDCLLTCTCNLLRAFMSCYLSLKVPCRCISISLEIFPGFSKY